MADLDSLSLLGYFEFIFGQFWVGFGFERAGIDGQRPGFPAGHYSLTDIGNRNYDIFLERCFLHMAVKYVDQLVFTLVSRTFYLFTLTIMY